MFSRTWTNRFLIRYCIIFLQEICWYDDLMSEFDSVAVFEHLLIAVKVKSELEQRGLMLFHRSQAQGLLVCGWYLYLQQNAALYWSGELSVLDTDTGLKIKPLSVSKCFFFFQFLAILLWTKKWIHKGIKRRERQTKDRMKACCHKVAI